MNNCRILGVCLGSGVGEVGRIDRSWLSLCLEGVRPGRQLLGVEVESRGDHWVVVGFRVFPA